MSKLPWTPWHEVVKLRKDLKSGELSLAMFAADLNDVALQRGQRPIYERPEQFFALTYPTYNLRQLARDVVLRLDAGNDKAVRQLELTYGGGKTHALITLYHLVNDPAALPELPAVQEFLSTFGQRPPRARVAALTFDHMDPVKGMRVRGPDGTTRRFVHPWTVLAYQLGGAPGLEVLGGLGGEERDEPPFTNVMEELLRLPLADGLSTLVLIDEVLMWARTKVGSDPVWRHRIQDFFQSLTQAATKVDRCCVVASLLATDPGKSDELGKEITHELYAIFRREREEGVLPVEKADVAELLRRRFFTPASIEDRQRFRPHVVTALKGITEIDEQTKKEGGQAEERYLASFPFHPELTDVFYTKWTGLEGFQRTRGVLRTFALALRDAEKWDYSPLVSTGVFLNEPAKGGISEAARELTTVAATEEYEGKRHDWTAILESELAKAGQVQPELPSLQHRELEHAVFATFLHSQPVGQKAVTRDLLVLAGATRPDRIELEKALRRWADLSWFLDETVMGDMPGVGGGPRPLPKAWRLGNKPNLRQMHDDAKGRISADLVEARLIDEIGKAKMLTAGASAAGARTHVLPSKPSDIEDDGEFHFAILRPTAVSDSGKASSEARRFLEETTSSDRPRVFRNAVVLVGPSRDGLEVARDRVRDYLAWEEVREQLKHQEIDPIRQQALVVKLDAARKHIPEAVRQAYCIVVTLSDKGDVHAFRITPAEQPLFVSVKGDRRTRIQETAVSAEALLPDGPYNLWREGETARRVSDLAGAFAQFPHLPKMLSRTAVLETLARGCREGQFVVHVQRPDRSVRIFWRQAVDLATLKEPGAAVALPGGAELCELHPELLIPGALPGLWSGQAIRLEELRKYFSGDTTVRVDRGGFVESLRIPRATVSAVEEAVKTAVARGHLWLFSAPASLLAEEVPAGVLTAGALLMPPPPPIAAPDLLPDNMPEAWNGEGTTVLAVATQLSQRAGRTLPWVTVQSAVTSAIQARLLELRAGEWPSAVANAANVHLGVARGSKPKPDGVGETPGGRVMGRATLSPGALQDLAERVGELSKAGAGHGLSIVVEVSLGEEAKPPDEVINRVTAILREIAGEWELK